MESDAIGGVATGNAYPAAVENAGPEIGLGGDSSVVNQGVTGAVDPYLSLGMGGGTFGGIFQFPDCGWDPRRNDQSTVAERMAERVLSFVRDILGRVLPPASNAVPTSPASGTSQPVAGTPPAPSTSESSAALQTLQQVVGQLVALVQRLIDTLSGKVATAPTPQPSPTPTPTQTPAPAQGTAVTPGGSTPAATQKPEPHCGCEELKAKRAKRKRAKAKKRAAKAKQASAASTSAATGPTVKVPGAGSGFLWKPISDSDGKLAVLLPPSLTGKVSGVRVLSPAGEVLANGRHGGIGNGDREHFRFDRPGGAFPSGAIVEVTLKTGEVKRIEIAEPSSRGEG